MILFVGESQFYLLMCRSAFKLNLLFQTYTGHTTEVTQLLPISSPQQSSDDDDASTLPSSYFLSSALNDRVIHAWWVKSQHWTFFFLQACVGICIYLRYIKDTCIFQGDDYRNCWTLLCNCFIIILVSSRHTDTTAKNKNAICSFSLPSDPLQMVLGLSVIGQVSAKQCPCFRIVL